MAKKPRIGELRWLVTLARRVQQPAADGTGIIEQWVDMLQVHCAIEALNPTTYWGAGNAVGATAQTDFPISHMIRMRWVDILDNTHAILRRTILPNGSIRTEVYRVRRYQEVDGRKRFVNVEVQQEASRENPP